LTGLGAAATIVVVPLRLLLFAVVLLLAAPTIAQAFGPPQLFWRPYIPNTDGAWQPLDGATVSAFEPEIGILIGTDPAGKNPGRAVTVTKIPDRTTASAAMPNAGLCFTMPGAAGTVYPIGQMPFRGFGTYSIHAVALTNAVAMTSTVCDLTGAPASDTTFTVSAVPTLTLGLEHATLDDDSNLNFVAPAAKPGEFGNFPADYVCARNAKAGADGTPTGADRRTLNNQNTLSVPGVLRKVGAWSCAARWEAQSFGDQSTFTGPWGPLFTFDVTDVFRFPALRFNSLGGTRYSISGPATTAAAGGKVRATFVKGKHCPGGPKTIRKTMTISPAGRFKTTLTLPEGGSKRYYAYGWKVKIEFLGTRFIRAANEAFGIAVNVRSSGGQPHYRKNRISEIDDPRNVGCAQQQVF